MIHVLQRVSDIGNRPTCSITRYPVAQCKMQTTKLDFRRTKYIPVFWTGLKRSTGMGISPLFRRTWRVLWLISVHWLGKENQMMYQREFCGLCPLPGRRAAVIRKPWGQNRKKASNVSRLVIGLRASYRGHAASVSSVYKTVTCTTAALIPALPNEIQPLATCMLWEI
jgi:hypothetical protein